MKIEDVDRVNALKEEREQALELYKSSLDPKNDFGNVMAIARHFLPNDPMIAAVVETVTDRIVAINKELATLGVRTPPIKRAEMDAAGWRRTSEMYLRCWVRELGGRLLNKAHLIDALVLTTRKQRDYAELAVVLEKALRGVLNERADKGTYNFEEVRAAVAKADEVKEEWTR